MLGIPEAVDRIRSAIRTHQPIAIYGDYDVDGVTATALLTCLLKDSAQTCAATSPTASMKAMG